MSDDNTENFLADYKEYTNPLEVPDIFHVWCSLSCIAAAAQRKIWLDMGLFKMAPNLYVILNSPPGMCGKDTAMNVVRDMLMETKAIRTKSDSITKEKIFSEMAAACMPFELPNGTRIMHSSLTIFASEMSLLIKKGDKDFVSALNALFNTASSFKHSTKSQGESVLINPYLNILGGTTPNWINDNIQEDIIEGGLSARTILVFCNVPKPPNPFPFITEAGELSYCKMIRRIERITQLGGKFDFSANAMEVYKDWYLTHHKVPPEDYRMMGYHYRKRVHILKLTMIMSLAYKDELVILPEDVLQAIELLKFTEKAIEKSLAGVGRNELNRYTQAVLALIRGAKKIKLEDVVANTFNDMSMKELEEIIKALTAMKTVKIYKDIQGKDWLEYVEKEGL